MNIQIVIRNRKGALRDIFRLRAKMLGEVDLARITQATSCNEVVCKRLDRSLEKVIDYQFSFHGENLNPQSIYQAITSLGYVIADSAIGLSGEARTPSIR